MTAEHLTMVTRRTRSKVTLNYHRSHHHLSVSNPPTCIIILSSMRSGSVGIAGHLGPIPPAAGKTPRDHLQLQGTSKATPTIPPFRPQLASLLINCTSRLRLLASSGRQTLLPNCPPNPLSVSSQLRSISSSQEFTFSAFVAFRLDCNCVAPLGNCNLGRWQLFLRRTVGSDCRPTLCATADRAAAAAAARNPS